MRFLRLLLASVAAVVGLMLAVPVVALGLPFWGIVGLARLARPLVGRFVTRAVTWQEVIEFEPTVGWKPRAHLDTHVTADRPFHLVTDEHGWRGPTSLTDSDMVAFGDSFAFGYGADERTFFASEQPTVRIKAIGANGYSMVQELLWMERLSAQLAGKIVVWFIYYGNDLYDNLQPHLDHYRMPFVRARNGPLSWEIVTYHVGPEPWPFASRPNYTARLAEICSPTLLSNRAFGACRFLIARGRDLCTKAGARLVVMGIPQKHQLSARGRERLAARAPTAEGFDYELPDRKIAEICHQLGIQFIALTDHLTHADYKQKDTHWNAHGSRRVAAVLAETYRTFADQRNAGESTTHRT